MMEDFMIVYFCITTGASFSIIGNIFIILVYLKYDELHTFAYNIILVLSILNLIESIWIVIPADLVSYNFCIIQAFANQFFGLNSIFWTGSISLILYLQVVKESENTIKYAKIFFALSIFISLCLSTLLFFLNSYNYVGGDCWINNNGIDKILRFAFFYIPAWVVILVISVVYWSIIKQVNRSTLSFIELDDQRKYVVNKLKHYPFIMIITFTPLTIYRIIQAYTTPVWLYAMSLGFFSLTGFINSIAYGLNETVRNRIFSRNKYLNSPFH